MTRRRLGRALQFLALMMLPFAMASQLMGAFGEGGLLLYSGVGVGVFYLGHQLQHR